MPVTLLVAPGHETRARRAAIRPADVAAGEADAVVRDGINVRRGHLVRDALAAQLAPAEIVAEDDEDVGFAGGVGVESDASRDEGNREQAAEEVIHFHVYIWVWLGDLLTTCSSPPCASFSAYRRNLPRPCSCRRQCRPGCDRATASPVRPSCPRTSDPSRGWSIRSGRSARCRIPPRRWRNGSSANPPCARRGGILQRA